MFLSNSDSSRLARSNDPLHFMLRWPLLLQVVPLSVKTKLLFITSHSIYYVQLDFFLSTYYLIRACLLRNCRDKLILLSAPSLVYISLTFIFPLIEPNKKIMFDIKSLWTCGPADYCACLFLHGKCFTLWGGVCLSCFALFVP